MEDNENPVIYLSWLDSVSKPLEPYVVKDLHGDRVIINYKNKDNHDSSHRLQDNPCVFHNLGAILINPDSCVQATSANPEALKKAERGTVYEYTKVNFISSLDIPGMTYRDNDEVKVYVMKEDPEKVTSAKNYSLTYRINYKIEK